MVCMCDNEGNMCDECKIREDNEGDYYLWKEEERLNKIKEGEKE